MTLERVEQKPEIYTLPLDEEDTEGVTNWFEQVDTTISDSPMEYSTSHYSVCDTIQDIMENDAAFEILAGFLWSVSGMKLSKSMLGMMQEKTLLEMKDMLLHLGNDNSLPKNALEIVNARLCEIPKSK